MSRTLLRVGRGGLTWAGVSAALVSPTAVYDERGQTGSPISAWANQLGAAPGLAASGGQEPDATTLNGYAAADFVPSSDTLHFSTFGNISVWFTSLATLSAWIVIRPDSASGTNADTRLNNVLFCQDNAAAFVVSVGTLSGVPNVSVGLFDGTALRYASTPITFGATYVVQIDFDSSNLRIRANGGAWVSTAVTGGISGLADILNVGNASYGGLPYDGKIGTIITCAQKQSAGVGDNMQSFLRSKYGV